MFYPKAMDIVFQTMSNMLGRNGASPSRTSEDNDEDDDPANVSGGKDYVELLRHAYEEIKEMEKKQEHLSGLCDTLKNQVRDLESENKSLSSNLEIFKRVVNDTCNEFHEKLKSFIKESQMIDKYTATLERILRNESVMEEIKQAQACYQEHVQTEFSTVIPARFSAIEEGIDGNKQLISKANEENKESHSRLVEMMEQSLKKHSELEKSMENITSALNELKKSVQEDREKIDGRVLQELSTTLKTGVKDCGDTIRMVLTKSKESGLAFKQLSDQVIHGILELRELQRDSEGHQRRLEDSHLEQMGEFKKLGKRIDATLKKVLKKDDHELKKVNGNGNNIPHSTQTAGEEDAVDITDEDDNDESHPASNGLDDTTTIVDGVIDADRKRKITKPPKPNQKTKRRKQRVSADFLAVQESRMEDGDETINMAENGIEQLPAPSTSSDFHSSPATTVSTGLPTDADIYMDEPEALIDDCCQPIPSTPPNLKRIVPVRNAKRKTKSKYALRNISQVNYTDSG